jgi:Zn-dependent peptidase ImmA (M78 family)/DNA-binding XRE family transcriptional regulator
MISEFNGAALRLARLFNALTLEEVAQRVGKSRQYVHKLETGQAVPTAQLLVELAGVLRVEADFFLGRAGGALAEEQIHFRKLMSTPLGIKQVAMARAEMVGLLVATLERRLRLPEVRIPTVADAASVEDVERAADECRKQWELGLGPIADMTKLAELVGAVVTSFASISTEVDAMSFALGRPIIVRNEAKNSACRQRFDIAHELGHAVLHSGRPTGDHQTESEAHRFATALLVPRSMMMKLFPRSRGERLDWVGLSEFKYTWKISKAAVIYRARQLELLSDQQYKSGILRLKRGQAQREDEDDAIPMEEPTLLRSSFDLLARRRGIFAEAIASDMKVSAEMVEDIAGFPLPRQKAAPAPSRPTLRLVA